MKKQSIGLSLLVACLLIGCEQEPQTGQSQIQTRSIHVAGIPAYDKDYRLDAQNIHRDALP